MVELRVIYGQLATYLLYGLVHSSSGEHMPPQITSPLSQGLITVDAQERQRYQVLCTASGNPVPTFQWKKDELLLDGRQDSVTSSPDGILHFKNFTDEDNGYYQCFATNKYGTSLSEKVFIVSEKPAKRSNGTIKPENAEAKPGESKSLECSVPPTVPKWIPRWYQTDGTKELNQTKRIGTDSHGVLRFAFTEPGDSKKYTCGMAPSSATSGIIFTNTIDLQVKGISNVDYKAQESHKIPPKLEYSSNQMKAVLGNYVTLECFFSGDPVPEITWTNSKNQVIVGSSKFNVHDYNRKVTIRDVSEDDQGDYSCTASNGFGEKTHFMKINVTSSPKKIPHHGLSSAVRPDRHNILLQCKAQAAAGETLNVPVWYRNGRPLNEATVPDQQRYLFSSDYTELTILNPDKTRDTACFQCNVSNSEGYAFYDAYLKIIESIKITRQPEAVYEISRSDVIDISIKAAGDDCCRIVKDWYLNGARLTQEELNSPPFVHQGTDVMMFDPRHVPNDTLASRLGHYMCNVSNIYDFQVVEFSISMLAVATDVDALGAGNRVQLWWVILLCGILFIIIAAAIIFVIIKTNFPRQSYQLEKTELRHNLNPEEDLLNQSFQNI